MKFPELTGEAGLLERDGNLTGLTGVCKNKVGVVVRVCCRLPWAYTITAGKDPDSTGSA